MLFSQPNCQCHNFKLQSDLLLNRIKIPITTPMRFTSCQIESLKLQHQLYDVISNKCEDLIGKGQKLVQMF